VWNVVLVLALHLRRYMSPTHLETIDDLMLGSVCGGAVEPADLPKDLLNMNSWQQQQEAMRRGGTECLAAFNDARQLSIFAGGAVERRGGNYQAAAYGSGKYLGADAITNHPACATAR
jgi:hypothetical protein